MNEKKSDRRRLGDSGAQFIFAGKVKERNMFTFNIVC